MVTNGKKAQPGMVRKDVPMNAADTMNRLSVDQLKQRSESLIENIGALRFSVARIELLDGYRMLFRDLLADCRVPLDAHGMKGLVKKIDKVLKETDEREPPLQAP